MTRPMTSREEAEAIWQIGQDIAKLLSPRLFERMSPAAIDRWNAIANVEHIDTIAAAITALGDTMCRECEATEEAEDRRRDNPFEPDHRRLGQ